MTYFFRIVFLLIVLIPTSLIACFVALFSFKRTDGLVTGYNRLALKTLGITFEVEDENGPGFEYRNCVLVLLNQTSLLDGAISNLILPRPVIGITNIEFAMLPFYGWMMMINCFVIVRQWPAQAKRKIQRVVSYLASGGNVHISIEGKRSPDGRLQPYKKGPVVMAINAKSHIVPLFYENTRIAWPYGSLRIRPAHIKIRFLKAISMQDRTYDDRNAIVAELKTLARNEQNRMDGAISPDTHP